MNLFLTLFTHFKLFSKIFTLKLKGYDFYVLDLYLIILFLQIALKNQNILINLLSFLNLFNLTKFHLSMNIYILFNLHHLS